MRKVLFLLLLFFWACINGYAQQEQFPFLATVISDRVHIRAGQSVNFESLYQLNRGDDVFVLGRKYSWYKVQLPAKAKSFVNTKFVSTTDNQFGVITGSRVNIRAGAGNRNMMIGQLKKGDQVVIFDQLEGEWTQIQPNEDAVGWILDELLEFKSRDVTLFQAQLKAARIQFPVAAENEVDVSQEVAVTIPVAEQSDQVSRATLELQDLDIKEEKPSVVTKDVKARTVDVVVSKPKKVLEEKQVKDKEEINKHNDKGEKQVLTSRTQERDYPVFESDGHVRASGILIKGTSPVDDQIEYALQVDGQTAYNIRGLKYLFDDFIDYEVYLEGIVTPGRISKIVASG